MGAYLCISLANKIVISKDAIRNCKLTESEAIEKTINEYGSSIDIYELIPDEKYVILNLKQEVLEHGLLPFLADFYPDYYTEYKEDKEDYEGVLKSLRETPPAEWLSSANKIRAESFQRMYDTYNRAIRCPFGLNLRIESDNIALCLNGKIIMETYDTLFKYLGKCLQDRYKKHAIAQALNVFITN